MQNFPSLITSRVVSPLPEETILDCCAAPGNKWSHLAMIMEDKGLVVGTIEGDTDRWEWTVV